ncbi:multiple coagulation factor deficiency protein 2-like isoform X2 [Leptotrombidium deliense]|uniref:Multiple coagulation factor deficiency protein 2-like isoform X2 n=1 Tax=Leptotrombidium deliense TaxID=299467 RepID=A0A443SBV2_9ACAR|nr:multiple coagulation factor deficiency protein 2-like isoform X2 [Leptotrombidium deliense]
MALKLFVTLFAIVICMPIQFLNAEEDESLWDTIWGHDDEEQKEHALHDIHDHYGSALFSVLTANELQFQLFDSHDYDKNGKLDGLELLAAMHHSDHNNSKAHHSSHHQPVVKTLQSDVAMIDSVMQLDDVDNDGYLDYAEFVSAADRNPKSKVIKSINVEKKH